MARVVVRRTARSCPSLEALCAALSRQLGPGADQEEFCRKCMACAEDLPGARGSASGTSSGVATALKSGARPTASDATVAPPAARPASGPGPEQLAGLQAELARHIGPLARVLVKRAAQAGGTLAEIAARLEENIPDAKGRTAFRAAALRLD